MIRLRDNDTLNFNILAPMASADGYGYSAEELVRAAVYSYGSNIGFVVHDWADKKYTGDDIKSLEIPREQIGQKQVFIMYFIPYAFYQNDGLADFPIGQTMFETTEIPDIWAWCCNKHTKGVIVPSDFCREVFERKLDVPVEVTPLGVNTNVYHYVERKPSETFTFLMAGSLHYRKGADLAVQAFQEEFSSTEKVRLVLKTRRGFLDLGKHIHLDPRIQIVDCDYSRSDMLDFYHAGDCFVACSRGEAAGLTPREAMATGIPAIVTDWGGLREIADSRYTFPIEIEDERPAPTVCSSYDQGITQGESIGDFCEPSISSLREAMRTAYEDKEETARKGRQAAYWIAEDWNYERCARKWLEAIERIYDGTTQSTHGNESQQVGQK